MTDRQARIDGVDVSKCEHLTEIQGCWLSTCDYLKYKGNITNKLCKYNHNCYYKQLARKEQECEELKERLESFQKDYSKLYQVVENKGYIKELDQLKRKVEELQAQRNFTTQEQRKIYCVAYDKTCETGNECKQKECVFKDRLKYKQALDDIEKFCTVYSANHDAYEMVYKDILAFINNVKER